MRHQSNRVRGMSLVAVVLIVAASFMFITAGASDSVNMGLQHASRTHYNLRTNYAAYGALQLALDKLNQIPTYACDENSVPVPDDPDLVYSLLIFNNYNGATGVDAPDGRHVPPHMAYIRCRGDFRAYPGRYLSSIFSKAYVGDYNAAQAVVGTDSVLFKSYSTDPAHPDTTLDSVEVLQNTSNNAFKWYMPTPGTINSGYKRALIATNSVQAGGLKLVGQGVSINGDLRWGPSGDEGTVLAMESGAQWNSTGSQKRALLFPSRVPRFRPPYDPALAVDDIVINGGSQPLPPGAYNSLTMNGGQLNLRRGNYLFKKDVTLSNGAKVVLDSSGPTEATGEHPCDIYVGNNVKITGSDTAINMGNAPDWVLNYDPAQAGTPKVVTPATVALAQTQAAKGPRTLRIFFVGSGAPNEDDCNFYASAAKLSLCAAGKAMRVVLTDGCEAYGGFKGSSFIASNARIHYQKVGPPDTGPVTYQRNDLLGRFVALSSLLMMPELPLAGQVGTPSSWRAAPFPTQDVPAIAWTLQGLSGEEKESEQTDADVYVDEGDPGFYSGGGDGGGGDGGGG